MGKLDLSKNRYAIAVLALTMAYWRWRFKTW